MCVPLLGPRAPYPFILNPRLNLHVVYASSLLRLNTFSLLCNNSSEALGLFVINFARTDSKGILFLRSCDRFTVSSNSLHRVTLLPAVTQRSLKLDFALLFLSFYVPATWQLSLVLGSGVYVINHPPILLKSQLALFTCPLPGFSSPLAVGAPRQLLLSIFLQLAGGVG